VNAAVPRPPIYLGDNRAIAFLESGEPIAIDTAGPDSLKYSLGHVIEGDIFPLFRRLLRHDSVVLDIGAHYGHYTLRAAPYVLPAGQIFCFEGNPHTFGCLERSLWANQLETNPRVHAYNVLVHDRPGRAAIHYRAWRLERASMWELGPGDSEQLSAEVATAALDDLLPADLAVDVVKMDIQGSEPYALCGMQKILARSPDIKIITEFFTRHLDSSFGAMNYQALIAQLGLSMWRIDAGGTLTLIDPATPLTGDANCLLARRLDLSGLDSRDIIIEPRKLSLKRAYAGPADPILRDGRIVYDASRHAGVEEDVLFYGPYINLEPGKFELSFSASIHGEFRVEVTEHFGEPIAQFTLDGTSAPARFTLRSPAQKFEIVLSRTANSKMIDLASIRLRKM